MRSPKDIPSRFVHFRLFEWCRRRWALLIALTLAIVLAAGAVLMACKDDVRAVPAKLFETKIVTRGQGPAKWHYFDYNLPKAGSATLRLSNGARTDAPSMDRVAGAEVTLRGKAVVTPKEFNLQVDVLQVPVELQAGTNRLGVRLKTDAGKRVSLRIDAPADTIVLSPVPNAAVVGREPLRARATVTALGRPVRRAEVQFEVLKLGRTIARKAETSNAGVATAFLKGFDTGKGELQAKLIGTDLTDVVPITALANRTLSMRQRPVSVRLEAGSGRMFGLAINLDEVHGDQEIVTLKQVVRPAPGSEPGGVLVRSNFPSQGKVVTAPKNISVNSTVTAVNPGRYSVTTTVAVGDKAGARARESFSTELAVVVVPAGTPHPLRLSKPLISPSGITPGSRRAVTFRTLVAGVSNPPQVLFLDRVSNRGELIAQETELRDDGKAPDSKAGDGFYSGRLELGSEEETEIYFRLRADYLGKRLTSGIAVLPITRLPLGSRPSTGPLVDHPNGQDKIFTNEVVVGALEGVSPRRVQSIVAEVGSSLGLEEPGAIRIEGYIPSLDAYLVAFDIEGAELLEGVHRVASAFLAYAEVKYASPSIQGRLAANWWLDNIGINELRNRMDPDPEDSSVPPFLPVYGASEIGVAIIDYGVYCGDPDLVGRCADSGTIPVDCRDTYKTDSGSDPHGTKVAALVAGGMGAPPDIQGVDEGVAWKVTLLPFLISGSQFDVADAMDCAVRTEAQILNISWEADECYADPGDDSKRCLNPIEGLPPDAIPLLQDATCKAIDNDRLVVAAAGNAECSAALSDRFPASYNDASTTCSDVVTDPNGWMLKVGGTDSADKVGGSGDDGCDDFKSQEGEIYAPGWGIGSDDAGSNGTSWSTALVSGCAAVVASVQAAKGNPWDPQKVEARLRETSDATGPVPLMDCWAAVADLYDIVFVLDRSGSMLLPADAGPTTRWEALTDAVNGLMPLIYATSQEDNKFGLTLFATTVLEEPAELSGLVDINSDDDSDDSDDSDELQTKVADALDVTPGGTTAMGAGLIDGLDKARITLSPRTRVVVLFTDGEENQPPFVKREDDETEVGCVLSNEYEINNPCPVDEESVEDGTVKIITVGIVRPDSSYLDTLQTLAQKNRGTAIITTDGAIFSGEMDGIGLRMDSIQEAFSLAIAPALSENSPQVVASYKGRLSEMATLTAFDLNKNVSQLLINISFSKKLKKRELSAILGGLRITKDGTDITRFFRPIFPSNLTNSVLLRTKFTSQGNDETDTIPPEGSYTVHIPALSNQAPDLGYKVVAYADDHLLDMVWRISPAAPRVNHPFTPTIRLSWRGKPVTNAHVEARVLKPGDDMGDLLAKHPQKIDPSGLPDAGSPGYQKYLHVREKDPDFLAKLQPNEEELTLVHRGDGRYSAAYNPGDVSGVYQILYRVHAEDTEFGKIQRLAVQSVYTRFGDIDLDESAVSTTVKGKTVTINFRPVTTYGRFIGPAQGNAFMVDGAGIRLDSVTDHQDGSYTLVLAGSPDALISIKLLGDEIYRGPASQMGKGIGWLIWLIIVLILLLMFWLIRRVI